MRFFGFPFIFILRMRVSVRLAIGRAPGGQSGGARCIAIHRRARVRCAVAVPIMNVALTHVAPMNAQVKNGPITVAYTVFDDFLL